MKGKKMRKNYFIDNEDLKNAGYYFISSEEEKKYLDLINDELVYRVGEGLREVLCEEEYLKLLKLSPEEIQLYLKGQGFEFEKYVLEVRSKYLNDIKKQRKNILLK